MVYEVATAEYAPGKREEALGFLKKVAVYYRKNAGVDLHVVQRMAPGPGQQARLTTIMMIDSMAKWDDFQQKKKKDPEWQALTRDAFVPEKGCLVHNSYTRTFLEVL